MRGNAAEREIAGRILGNCVERYLKRDVWAYSMLAALQPAPKIVFDITKVSRVFEIVPTAEDAKF